jgi:hypothetical protein
MVTVSETSSVKDAIVAFGSDPSKFSTIDRVGNPVAESNLVIPGAEYVLVPASKIAAGK